MLLSASRIKGLKLQASDGELGKVMDIYFDDHAWTVRYFVVRAGGWLENRQVLLSPACVARPSLDDHVLPVRLTRDQIRNSPDIDTDKPVSRQHELELVNYYGWPAYWEVPYTGAGPVIPPVQVQPWQGSERTELFDPHLRSLSEVERYRIHATDGDIGHLEDLLIDDASWTIRYMVVDTRNWLPARRVLSSPMWVLDVDWQNRLIAVDASKETIKSAPAYDPAVSLTRQYEDELFRHYQASRSRQHVSA
jgi:hypothetical protein